MWRTACALGLLAGCGMITVNGKPLGSGGGGGAVAADDAEDGESSTSTSTSPSTSTSTKTETETAGDFCETDRAEPTIGVIAGVACGDRRSKLSASLFAHRETGDDGVLVAAGFVALCQSLAVPEQGELDYVGYRFCAAELDAAPADEVDAALDGVDGDVRRAFRAAYDAGAANLAAAAPRIAQHEKAAPQDKKIVDAAFAEARDTWAPKFRTWGKVLASVDGWQRDVSRDSDAAAGCEDRFGKLLAKYLGEAGGDLVEAAQDPIGYHLVLALAVCEAYSDDGTLAEATASLVRTEGGHYIDGKNVDPSRRVDETPSYHRLVDTLVQQRLTAAWKDKPKPSSWMRLYNQNSDLELGERTGELLAWRSDNTHRDHWDIVAKVAKKGDAVVVSFKKQYAAGADLATCAPWYDDRGREHQQTHCKTVKLDRTSAPLRLPRDEGKLLKAGDLVGYVISDSKDDVDDYGSKTPRDGRVLAVRRGKKWTYLLGASAK